MIDTILNLLSAAAILVAALSIGIHPVRKWLGAGLGRSELLLIALGVGLAILSYLILILGIFGLIYPATGYIIVGIALTIGLPQLRPVISHTGKTCKTIYHLLGELQWTDRALIFLLIISAGATLVTALAPPNGSDELNYNFALPKLYLESHHTGYIQSHRFSATPFGMEMLWLFGMMIHSATVAQLLNWFMGISLAFASGTIATKLHSLKAGLIAACLVYGITIVGDLSGGGKPELGGSLFLVLSVIALLHWRKNQSNKWLIIAAIFAGVFAGTKLPNPLIVASLVLAITLYAWRLWGLQRAVYSSGVLTAVAVLIFGIWMMRSWTTTGNPVYPFLPTIFAGRDLPDLSLTVQSDTGPASAVTSRSDPILTPGQFLEYRHPLAFLASPWTISVDNSRYRGLPGPIFLGMLPAILLLNRKFKPDIRFLLLIALFIYVGWFFSRPMLRNGIPVLALLSVPTSIAFLSVASKTRWSQWIMGSIFGAWLAVSLINNGAEAWRSLPVVTGTMTKESWLTTRLPMADRGFKSYPAYQFMNENLPVNSKVLLWESRGFYLERPYLRVYEFMYGLASLQQLRTATGALQELREWNITHVAMNDEGKRAWLRENLENSGQLECIYEDDQMVVCSLPWARVQ